MEDRRIAESVAGADGRVAITGAGAGRRLGVWRLASAEPGADERLLVRRLVGPMLASTRSGAGWRLPELKLTDSGVGSRLANTGVGVWGKGFSQREKGHILVVNQCQKPEF